MCVDVGLWCACVIEPWGVCVCVMGSVPFVRVAVAPASSTVWLMRDGQPPLLLRRVMKNLD